MLCHAENEFQYRKNMHEIYLEKRKLGVPKQELKRFFPRTTCMIRLNHTYIPVTGTRDMFWPRRLVPFVFSSRKMIGIIRQFFDGTFFNSWNIAGWHLDRSYKQAFFGGKQRVSRQNIKTSVLKILAAGNETQNLRGEVLFARKSIPKTKEVMQTEVVKKIELRYRNESNDYAIFGHFHLFCFR